jgi:hypothetical protein
MMREVRGLLSYSSTSLRAEFVLCEQDYIKATFPLVCVCR